MELLVCIKQVPDDSVKVKLGADGQPAISEITPAVNSFDTYALEMAVRLKEANEGAIKVITAGDIESVTPSLRNCLSVGADTACCINETEGNIPGLLAKAAGKGSYDVIFTGSETTDFAYGDTGARIAEELDMPYAGNALSLEKCGDKALVKQETETGYRMIEVSMPCVVSVAKPDYEPRYPSIKTKMAARKMPIEELKAEELGVACAKGSSHKDSFREPAKRTAGEKIMEKEATVAVSRAVAMLSDRKIV